MSLCSSSSSLGSDAEDDGDAIVISSRSRVLISPRRSGRSIAHRRRKRGSSRPETLGSSPKQSAAASRASDRERKGKAAGGSGTDGGEDSDRQRHLIRSSVATATPRQRSARREKSLCESSSSGDDERQPSSRVSTSRQSYSNHPKRTDTGLRASSALDTAASGSLEELKLTLRKLARQTGHKHSMTPSAASSVRDYVRAMPSLESLAASPPAEQLRLAEYFGSDTSSKLRRHASFQSPTASPRWSAASRPRQSTSLASNDKRSDSTASLGRTKEPPSITKKPFGCNHYAPASDASAQGSRALLSALKALQDKIRRLEEEREALTQELSDCKAKARKQEAELGAKDKQFAYELGQTKESARAAYEAVRMEREELRLDLAKAEERDKAARSELEHVRALAQTFSAKADDVGTQLQISEKHRGRLEADMDRKDRESDRAVRELKSEVESVREQLEKTLAQLETATARYTDEAASHEATNARLRESEQTVAALSQLHDKLLAKVWEATEAANAATKKSNKLMQQQRVSTLARPTAASAASASALAAKRHSESSSSNALKSRTGPRVAEGSAGAPIKAKKKVPKSKSTSKPTKKAATAANNMTLLREANLGRDVPFILGNSASRSFSVIGNVQDAIRQCDTTYMAPVLNGTAAPTSTWPAKKQSKPPSRRGGDAPSVSASILQAGGEFLRGSGSSSTTPRSTRSRPGSGAAVFKKNKPDAIKVPPNPRDANPFVSPMQAQIMQDLGAAVEAAEHEFRQLNARYKEIVSQIDSGRTAASEGDGGASHSTAQLSQALGPLLDELEAKSKQVNLLKQVFQTAAGSTINPIRRVVLSPEAVRRKTASLRVLSDYRQLERAARGSAS